MIVNLNTMTKYCIFTVKELKKIAAEHNIKIPSKTRKAELIQLIENVKIGKSNDSFCGLELHTIEGIWTIGNFISKGVFGRIYSVSCPEIVGKYIAKFEKISSKSTLNIEISVYKQLNATNSQNWLKLIDSGECTVGSIDYRYMILPMLDYTLFEYKCKFKVKTDLPKLLLHISTAIRDLHMNGWCHMDIKPQNIMYSKTQKRWYLIDLGLCVENPREAKSCNLRGTLNYMARNVHQQKYSQKSDIESFFYTLAYVSGVQIPWMENIPHGNTETLNKILLKSKEEFIDKCYIGENLPIKKIKGVNIMINELFNN